MGLRVEMMTWPRGPTPTTDAINWREARYLVRVVQMLVTSPPDKAEFKRELELLTRAAEALRAGVPSSRAIGTNGADDSDPQGRTEDRTQDRSDGAGEGAVLALWRTGSSAVRERTEGARDAAAAHDVQVSRGATEPVDEAELVRAVAEIEHAAAVLRADEPGSPEAVAWAVEEIERAAAVLRADEPSSAAAVARAVAEIERAAAALRADEPGSSAALESDAGPRQRPSEVWPQILGLWISIVAAAVVMVISLLIFMR
jgi:hypothetical protein